MLRSILRAISLLLGFFLVANAACSLAAPGWELTVWLVDLRPIGNWRFVPLLVSGVALIAFALWSPRSGWSRLATIVAIAPVMAFAVVDCVRYANLLGSGTIASGSPVSLSIAIVALLVIVLVSICSPRVESATPRRIFAISALALTVPAILPLCLMWTFGLSDYRRPADAILVLGARVYSDGRPSDVLRDRVETACDLYLSGLASRIVFSGGPGDGTVSESVAMRAIAISRGVPSDACILDETGLNTRATFDAFQKIAKSHNWRSSLAVSDFYHLPRIKLLADRMGIAVRTVPARQRNPRSGTPIWMAREVAAWWAYALGIPTS
ncbi:MAG: YdcF family protein [Phycisphaeraceae bacterium]|nr:YdcF family protein [Phycisphaeraceae bacterium]